MAVQSDSVFLVERNLSSFFFRSSFVSLEIVRDPIMGVILDVVLYSVNWLTDFINNRLALIDLLLCQS